MKFSEYLNSKGKTVEQPVVTPMADKLETEPKANSAAQSKTKKAGKKHDQVKEFVDAKGKLVEKPATEIIADYKGPKADAPESKGAKPYKNGKDGTVADIGKGLADEGPKDLIYNPNTKGGNSDNIPGGTNVKSFLDETRNMNTEEFTRHMKGKIGFDAIKSIKDLVKLSENNNSLFFNLAYEIKRNGKLSNLLEALLGIPETYSTIAKLVKEDTTESRVKYLYNAINEAVGPPVGMDDIDSSEEENDEDEMDLSHPGDEEGSEDDEMGPDEMGDEEGSEDDEMGPDEMGDEEGSEDDEMGPDEMGDMGQPSHKPFPSFKQKFNF